MIKNRDASKHPGDDTHSVIEKLRNDGWSHKRIAAVLPNKEKSTIGNICRKFLADNERRLKRARESEKQKIIDAVIGNFRKGYSQNEIAISTGVNVSSVGAILRGNVPVEERQRMHHERDNAKNTRVFNTLLKFADTPEMTLQDGANELGLKSKSSFHYHVHNKQKPSHLANRLDNRQRRKKTAKAKPTSPHSTPNSNKITNHNSHSFIQSEIARIGIELGYDVWVPTADRNKVCEINTKLKSSEGFLYIWPHANSDRGDDRLSRNTDVIWFNGNNISKAFEVENTTTGDNAAMNFLDIHEINPNIWIDYIVVAGEERREYLTKRVNREAVRIRIKSEVIFISYDEVNSGYLEDLYRSTDTNSRSA